MIKSKYTCPVCGKHQFEYNGDDYICPICYWQNDIIQNDDPDYAGGANPESLNEYRKLWAEGKTWMQIKNAKEKMMNKNSVPHG
ncbi:MAG: hydrolase [Oscillospiraceae bacterium]|nr:hydrolase [Oscillospiraceae bacterium]